MKFKVFLHIPDGTSGRVVTPLAFQHPKAKEFLEKLDQQTRDRIKNKIKELEEFLGEGGKRLKHSNFWTLRIGDYRAIYEVRSVCWAQEKRLRRFFKVVLEEDHSFGNNFKLYDNNVFM